MELSKSLTGDDVRALRFAAARLGRKGYVEGEVDAFLDRGEVDAALDRIEQDCRRLFG